MIQIHYSSVSKSLRSVNESFPINKLPPSCSLLVKILRRLQSEKRSQSLEVKTSGLL